MEKLSLKGKEKIEQLLKQLTTEEKATLLSGLDCWHTAPVERLGIPSIMMTDGPHGLRKQCEENLFEQAGSYKATCFPPACLLACSWDTELAEKQGKAIAEEASDQGVSVVLGPGNNIKRSPLCGRNFEYLSEDPFLSSHMAKGIIDGLQNNGIGCSLKHFCANNQETDRWTIDTIIDERTLREIYLASFEYAVKNADPATIMVSYNRLAGDYTTQSKWLINDILRGEWGFDGLEVSDWGAVDNRPQSVYAGLDLEMPASNGFSTRQIIDSVNGKTLSHEIIDGNFGGKLTEDELDTCVRRVLTLVYTCVENTKELDCDYDAHHQLAAEIASESMVLLKNFGILPLKKGTSVSVIGELAKNPRYQGSGSSRVNSYKLSNILDEISEYGEVKYACGYSLDDDNDMSFIDEAVSVSAQTEVTVLVLGLPDSYECEGYDRRHMKIPESHIRLAEKIAEVQKNIVVVLCNGAPVEMPFLSVSSAVLEAYLGGDGGGKAVADILFGKCNPCGKLAETFPVCLEQNPSYNYFGGDGKTVIYNEGVFVGYRFYDSKKIKPLFPFGYGLSYTEYEYSNMTLESISGSENILKVSVDVKNTGKTDGKEIVQLYVSEGAPSPKNPVKALKGFKKVFIKAGETKTVEIQLDRMAFSVWDAKRHEWTIENGTYIVSVGSSSADIRAEAKIDFYCERTKRLTLDDELNTLVNHKYGQELTIKLANMLGIGIKDLSPESKQKLTPFLWLILKKAPTLANLKMPLSELQSELDKINRKIDEEE